MSKFVSGAVFGATVAIAASAGAQVFVEVTGRGTLKGYEVQANGRLICRNPTAYPNFRGGNYIICE